MDSRPRTDRRETLSYCGNNDGVTFADCNVYPLAFGNSASDDIQMNSLLFKLAGPL